MDGKQLKNLVDWRCSDFPEIGLGLFTSRKTNCQTTCKDSLRKSSTRKWEFNVDLGKQL